MQSSVSTRIIFSLHGWQANLPAHIIFYLPWAGTPSTFSLPSPFPSLLVNHNSSECSQAYLLNSFSLYMGRQAWEKSEQRCNGAGKQAMERKNPIKTSLAQVERSERKRDFPLDWFGISMRYLHMDICSIHLGIRIQFCFI